MNRPEREKRGAASSVHSPATGSAPQSWCVSAVTGKRQREMSNLTSLIEERLSISGVRLSKIMGTGPADAEAFADSSHKLIDLEMKSALAGRWRMATMSIIFAAIPAALYLASTLLAASQHVWCATRQSASALQPQ